MKYSIPKNCHICGYELYTTSHSVSPIFTNTICNNPEKIYNHYYKRQGTDNSFTESYNLLDFHISNNLNQRSVCFIISSKQIIYTSSDRIVLNSPEAVQNFLILK